MPRPTPVIQANIDALQEILNNTDKIKIDKETKSARHNPRYYGLVGKINLLKKELQAAKTWDYLSK